MRLIGYQVQMYKSVLDSGWIEIEPLTVLVGKNEAGKTTLLKALQKLNPFQPEPYLIDREWPRGHRSSKNPKQVVCTARFELTSDERGELAKLTDKKMTAETVDVTRNYAGEVEVVFQADLFSDRIHPNDIDRLTAGLPLPDAQVGADFSAMAQDCIAEARRLASEGRHDQLRGIASDHDGRLKGVLSPGSSEPAHSSQQTYLRSYAESLKSLGERLKTEPSMQQRAHEYVVTSLPTFIYMDEVGAFGGTALLNQVQERVTQKRPTYEDRALQTIFALSGLNLDEEVRKGNESDREQRRYDLSDAGATMNRLIKENWGQSKYDVEFDADGQQFFTFVKGEQDKARIRLDERSKGFQWFFSFDLTFLHESKGQFRNCVLLLDEPGLHLHPGGQEDLLRRLNLYAKDNVLIYTSHLPFMLDLHEPEHIRVVSETPSGSKVGADLTHSQPEAKLTLQAALGISARQSYLVAERNLIVEGADDYFILTELSNLLLRSGEEALPDDVMVSAAGGAPEVAYLATFMVGQELEVVALLDSDEAGHQARDKLVKRWITCYNGTEAQVLSLGQVVGSQRRTFAIEDLFPDDYYWKATQEVYAKQIAMAGGVASLPIGDEMLCKRVERGLEAVGIRLNKGSVAKVLRRRIRSMASAADLPAGVADAARTLFKAIRGAFPGK